MSTDPIVASDNAERGLVVHGEGQEQPEEDDEPESSSEEEAEPDYPAGAADPDRCTIGGPGANGGSAQLPVSFQIHTRDSRDKKLTNGGDYVVVKVVPGATALAQGAKESEAIVKDNEDGTYTATYSVECRGDYELSVDINGSAFGGSPFPVFFSPPDEEAIAEFKAQAAALVDAAGNQVDSATYDAAKDMPMPIISQLGKDAYKNNVQFPEDPDVLAKTVIVGDMNPAITLSQLEKLFSYSGIVQKVIFTGKDDSFALVEFGSAQEAESALTLDKLLVIDRQIKVEGAKTALDSKGQSGGTQFAALQLQQIQQLQKMQSEQHNLAAQVASMRVQAKTNPSAFAPGLPQNSASQKAAALSAIAALSRRLTGSSHNAPQPEAPAPGKRRREVSPTLRYRSDKRSRSRSPRRLPSSRSRRRSPPRGSPPRRRPSPSRRRSPDRRRDSDRDRRRDSDRDRDRARRRERERESERGRDGDRERTRDTDRRRDRSRDRSKRADKRERSKDVADQKVKPGDEAIRSLDSATDLNGDIAMPDAKAAGSAGWQEVDTRPTAEELEKEKAQEAEHLRQKALTALKSIDRTKDFDAPEEDPAEQNDKDSRRERRKHHKRDKDHKRDRKEKRSRRDRRKTPEEQKPSPNAEQPAEVAEETNNDDDLELPDLDP